MTMPYTIFNKHFHESKIPKAIPKAAFKNLAPKAAFGTAFGILRMFRAQNYEGVNEGW